MFQGIRKIWINGRLHDAEKPALMVFDRGFLYGDGVYETLRVYGGDIFQFPIHYRRLKSSARGIGLRIPLDEKTLRRGAERLVAANRIPEAALRITVSRGPGPLGFDPRRSLGATTVMMVTPVPHHPEKLYDAGIRLAVARVRRLPKECLDPSLKTTNNLNNILAKGEAIRRRAYEALMLNTGGELAEGTLSNVFFISKGVLKTPALSCGILSGVTRSLVLRLARKAGLSAVEGSFRLADLLRAEEAFITSTSLEVMPVTRVIDEAGALHRIGSGRVGPWVKRLREDYRRTFVRILRGDVSGK